MFHKQQKYPSFSSSSSLNLRFPRNNSHQKLSRLYAETDGSSEEEDDTNDTTSDNNSNKLDQLLQDPVESLRPAINYLKDHPDVKLSRSNWDALFRGIEQVTGNAEENDKLSTTNQQQQQNQFPIYSKARQEMTALYDELRDRGELRLYGAVTTQEPPAAGSTEISPPLLQEILDLPMSALTPAPSNNVLWLGAAVAVVEILTSIATGISFNTLGLLTLLVLAMDRLFLNGASLETALKWASPGVQDKILRHEAGHFLAAYLLGCPVEGIVLSAWAALRDKRFGSRQVSAGTSFFDPVLSQQINEQQQVTRSSMDRYAVIVMAGIAAEADTFGRADGGAGDELALIAFLSRIWSPDQIKNQARWGALQAVLLTRQYKAAYDGLVDALERGGTLGDCIFAIEKAARDHDLPGRGERRPLGYIVNDNGVAVWKVNEEEKSNDGTKETANVGVRALAVEAASTATTSTANESSSSSSVDNESTLEALQSYRSQVEQKLRDVDEKLKELS